MGGIVECRVNGLPAGLGEPFFDSVESLIGHAVFHSGGQGIEFGTGFAAAKMFGSEHNDAIEDKSGKTKPITPVASWADLPMATNLFSGLR